MTYRKQAGFTLVELIMVIVVLGLLAAAALPRFSRIDTAAHKSSVAAITGSFRSAAILVHAVYTAKGRTGVQTNLAGFGNNNVETSNRGFPTDTAGNTNPAAMNTTRCLNVWNGIQESPPTANTSTAGNPDYLVTATATVCTYTYRRGNVTRRFTYTPNTGAIVITNP